MSDVIVSGMRPTGALHIGHYVGVIKNWVELQDSHDCYYFVADWHALTALYSDVKAINKSRIEYVRGWLASGVDPKRAHIYNQSSIPEILNLSQFFLCLTPPGWADRSPSWKDLKVNPNQKLDNLGFYTYPILQAADIAILNGGLVPIGEDQLSHLEISREIVRKFNRIYKTKLVEPAPKLTKVPKLLGTDGRKMSSSYGNVISLQETEKGLQKKINKMKTDDQRGGVENPGNPENCSVFDYHKVFSTTDLVSEVNDACRAAGLSCGECKQKLGSSMKKELMPISELMGRITDDECMDVLNEGTKKVHEKVKESWAKIQTKTGF